MSMVTDAPAATAGKGFESLDEETQVEGVPVHGELP